MKTGLATAAAALTLLLLIPAAASAKRIAGVDVKPGCDFILCNCCSFKPIDFITPPSIFDVGKSGYWLSYHG